MAANAFTAPLAAPEKILQRQVQRMVRHQLQISKPQFLAEALHGTTVTFEPVLVFGANHRWIEINFFAAFDILEQPRAGKFKGQFL